MFRSYKENQKTLVYFVIKKECKFKSVSEVFLMVTINKKIFVLCIVEGSAFVFSITISSQGIQLSKNLPISSGTNFEFGDDIDNTKLYPLLKVKKVSL